MSCHLDINGLVGNKLPIQIPEVLVKWVTYALVLHIVALFLAGISAVFGLLAHVREMSMTCFSSCISGFAAVVALLAFIFDLSLFFIVKARINAVQGGSATPGNAIWLTGVAWVLLFFSGCFYTLGRCCLKRRPRNDGPWNNKGSTDLPLGGNTGYAEQMRLDAVKAEADRKARQRRGEGGLPAFQEYEPLKDKVVEEEMYLDDEPHSDPYRDQNNVGGTSGASYPRSQAPSGYSGRGYAQAPVGTRAVDEYYAPSMNQQATTYPPQIPTPQYLSATPQNAYAHAQGGTSCMVFGSISPFCC
jgi:hypothetical protein